METHRVSGEVFTAIQKFSASKTIGGDELQALGMIMNQDGIDADEQKVLDSLQNKVAFSVSDGRRSATLDPQTVKFPPKFISPADQASADRRNPVRAEIYQTLSQGGQSEEAIAKTFSYLDRVGVPDAEALELVRHQQARGWGADDSLAALQAYGVIQESVKIPELPEPNQRYLQQVAQELKAGNYRIDANAPTSSPYATAETDPTIDQIRYPGFDISSPEHRAIMLHEVVHASHDVEFDGKAHLGVSRGFSEMEAHLAQGLYLLNAERDESYRRGLSGDKPVLAFAEAYRDHIATQQAAEANPQDPLAALNARRAYEAFDAAETSFRAELENHRGYRISFITPKFADGITPK